MNSAHGPCACAARSRSNATSCSAWWHSRSIKYSASRSSGPRRPERRPLRPREHRENSPRSMNFARGSVELRGRQAICRQNSSPMHLDFCRSEDQQIADLVPIDLQGVLRGLDRLADDLELADKQGQLVSRPGHIGFVGQDAGRPERWLTRQDNGPGNPRIEFCGTEGHGVKKPLSHAWIEPRRLPPDAIPNVLARLSLEIGPGAGLWIGHTNSGSRLINKQPNLTRLSGDMIPDVPAFSRALSHA